MSDIFSADELAADQLAPNAEAPPSPPAPPAPPAPPSPPEPARDEQGRFAPKQGDPPAPEAEQRDERGNVVPQGALHAEREKRKTAEQQAREYKEQLDAIAAMRARVAQPQQPAAGDAPAADADDKAQLAYLRQRLEQIEGTQQQSQQRQQTEQLDNVERQQLSAALTTSEAEFRQSKPDYDEAIKHVITARAEELKLYGLSQIAVQQHLQQEVLDITRAAIDQGRSPAEVAYQLATFRGYRPDAGGQQQQQQPQSDAQKQLAAIAAARQGSRSLGQAAGSAPPKDLNATTIAAMSDDEFQALYSTPDGKRMIDAL
jgi:hypothetical protein